MWILYPLWLVWNGLGTFSNRRLWNQLVMTSCRCNHPLSLDTNQSSLFSVWGLIYFISDDNLLLVPNIIDEEAILGLESVVCAEMQHDALIHCEVFGILEAATPVTTHREENGSTCQCLVAT